MSPTIIHYLQMLTPSDLRPRVSQDTHFHVGTQATSVANESMSLSVGREFRHWRDKLLARGPMESLCMDPTLRTFVSYHQGHVAGYYELKHHDSQELKLPYSD